MKTREQIKDELNSRLKNCKVVSIEEFTYFEYEVTIVSDLGTTTEIYINKLDYEESNALNYYVRDILFKLSRATFLK